MLNSSHGTDRSFYRPFLNSPLDPPSSVIIDALALAFQILSVFLSTLAGVEALRKIDDYAAIFGIGAGIVSIAAVFFTGRASQIRDTRLAAAYCLGMLGVDMAEMAHRRHPFD